jgi:hypothetical protein
LSANSLDCDLNHGWTPTRRNPPVSPRPGQWEYAHQQAAFLERLPAATRAGIVSTDPFEGIPIGFDLAKFRFDILESPFTIGAAFIAKAVPTG